MKKMVPFVCARRSKKQRRIRVEVQATCRIQEIDRRTTWTFIARSEKKAVRKIRKKEGDIWPGDTTWSVRILACA